MNKIQSVVTFLATHGGLPLNETRIMKLAYVSELRSLESRNRRLTLAHWFHHKYGPFSRDVSAALEASPKLKMEVRSTPSGRKGKFYFPNRPELDLDLDEEEVALLREVGKDWQFVDNDSLVENTKKSPPFVWTKEGEDIPFDRYQEFLKRYNEALAPNFGEGGVTLESKEDIEAFVRGS